MQVGTGKGHILTVSKEMGQFVHEQELTKTDEWSFFLSLYILPRKEFFTFMELACPEVESLRD